MGKYDYPGRNYFEGGGIELSANIKFPIIAKKTARKLASFSVICTKKWGVWFLGQQKLSVLLQFSLKQILICMNYFTVFFIPCRII